MRKNCIICDGPYVAHPIRGLLRCTNCSFVTADVSLSPKQLAELYSSKYFVGEEYRDYISERDIIKKNFAAKLLTVLKVIEQPREKKAFEIGSAYGFFLETAKGYFNSIKGIDISEDAVRFAKKNGNDIVCQDFLSYPLETSYDAFFMWDTIEHLQSPDLYIKKIAQNIRPGGYVTITTGDIASLNARLRRSKWRQIHPPTHLHYFSKKTLTRLLEKNGFTVVHASHPGNYHSLDNIAYIVLVLKKNKTGLYRFIKKTRLLKLFDNLYVNFFDIMMVIAKKNEA